MSIDKSNTPNFQEISYNRHANWYNEKSPAIDQKKSILVSIRDYNGTINHWLQNIFFSCLSPFTKYKDDSWLTVGDAYGHDAMNLLKNGIKDVIASDLNIDFLTLSKEFNFITKYSAQNAEELSFQDQSIDYILCKESYHHFPRPYAALYEMLRVAKKGIVIIEPQDPIGKMPFLLFISNFLENIKRGMSNKIWKNRFSYEPVGNFVYKVSEREFEKLAAGLNLPMIAIRKINPNFWFAGSEKIPALNTNKIFMKIHFKKKLRDILSKIGIIPSQTLSIVVFKTLPDAILKNDMKKNGYRFVEIPKNPYL